MEGTAVIAHHGGGALEGELAALEEMWRQAEEIAAIADRLGLRDHLCFSTPTSIQPWRRGRERHFE